MNSAPGFEQKNSVSGLQLLTFSSDQRVMISEESVLNIISLASTCANAGWGSLVKKFSES